MELKLYDQIKKFGIGARIYIIPSVTNWVTLGIYKDKPETWKYIMRSDSGIALAVGLLEDLEDLARAQGFDAVIKTSS